MSRKHDPSGLVYPSWYQSWHWKPSSAIELLAALTHHCGRQTSCITQTLDTGSWVLAHGSALRGSGLGQEPIPPCRDYPPQSPRLSFATIRS